MKHLHMRSRSPQLPFQISKIVTAVGATLSLMSANVIYAADEPSISELQAEIIRLKQALEKSQQELSSQKDIPIQPIAEEGAADTKVQQAAQEEEPTELGKVVVRSRNKLEVLQDVPLSISVVTGKELERLQAQDLGEITKRAGNITWNQGNQRTSSLSIRGVGKVGQTEAQDPSVGVIVDGVSYAYNPLSSSLDFTDIDTVEVTRGPQGTLMGKSASLGVINITTRRPSFTPSADYSISYGERDTFRGRLSAGGAIVDDLLAWRGSFSVSKGAGDITNVYNTDNSYQNLDRVSGRAQFLLTPTENFSARIAFDVQPRSGENTNGRTIRTPTPTRYADGTPNPNNSDASVRLARRWFTQKGSYSYLNNYLNDDYVYNDAQQPVVTGSNGATAELNWRVGNYDLVSISAYKDYHFNAHNNDEGTPFDIQRSSGQQIDYRQLSQEFRISSQTEDGFVDYQAGLYFLNTSTNIRRNVIYGADAGAWFASTAQYNRLDANSNGRYLMQNSLDKLWKNENKQEVTNNSQAIFGQANWHLTDKLTVTTGVRFTKEDRRNPGSSLIYDNGNGAELNPSSINGVNLGGFDSYHNSTAVPVWVLNGNVVSATTPGAVQVAANSTGLTTDTNNAAALAQANAAADAAAQKYFGTASTPATWASLSDAQRRQINDAQTIRKARLGVLWNKSEPERFDDVQPAFVISPSYRINDNLSTYVSWQYGEKAGVSQQVNGQSYLSKPEKSSAFEWGVKSSLLNNTLILNADIFLTNIKDYQQAVQVEDTYTTNLVSDGSTYYTSATGNAPKVRVTGLEIDGVYAGIPHTTIRFAGAYNKAIYKEFKFSAQPAEYGNTASGPYRDLSGETLAGAAKYTANVGVDYRIPVFKDKVFHTSANWAYTSSYNSDNTLSEYGKIPANSLVDLSVGVGFKNNSYDLSLLVKNLFDDDTPLAKTWNSYVPAYPRWIGVVLTGTL